ncbi:MAG: hypothetical protein A4S09_13700 [Proteobacteria bacterium SG_bin7]|nr:MAG: hypothetical protein A4S09_13700 [Proteobacteria bacterium SG_bin7]
MSKTRAIRFSTAEEAQIEEFLKNNPLFDFSSLARMAILGFIKDPKITIHPIKPATTESTNRRVRGQPEQ